MFNLEQAFTWRSCTVAMPFKKRREEKRREEKLRSLERQAAPAPPATAEVDDVLSRRFIGALEALCCTNS
jgi:hypothetical protein